VKEINDPFNIGAPYFGRMFTRKHYLSCRWWWFCWNRRLCAKTKRSSQVSVRFNCLLPWQIFWF